MPSLIRKFQFEDLDVDYLHKACHNPHPMFQRTFDVTSEIMEFTQNLSHAYIL